MVSHTRSSGFIRSSRPEVLCKKGALRNFSTFTGKHLCQSIFFKKAAGLRAATWLKRDSGTGAFLWILKNFENHLFLQNNSGSCFVFIDFQCVKYSKWSRLYRVYWKNKCIAHSYQTIWTVQAHLTLEFAESKTAMNAASLMVDILLERHS